jgi:hypothetical protein
LPRRSQPGSGNIASALPNGPREPCDCRDRGTSITPSCGWHVANSRTGHQELFKFCRNGLGTLSLAKPNSRHSLGSAKNWLWLGGTDSTTLSTRRKC